MHAMSWDDKIAYKRDLINFLFWVFFQTNTEHFQCRRQCHEGITKRIGLFPHGPVPAGGLEPLPGKVMTTLVSFIIQGDLKVFVYKQHKGEEPPKKAIASQPIDQRLAASDPILIWAYIFGPDSVSADIGT